MSDTFGAPAGPPGYGNEIWVLKMDGTIVLMIVRTNMNFKHYSPSLCSLVMVTSLKKVTDGDAIHPASWPYTSGGLIAPQMLTGSGLS